MRRLEHSILFKSKENKLQRHDQQEALKIVYKKIAKFDKDVQIQWSQKLYYTVYG